MLRNTLEPVLEYIQSTLANPDHELGPETRIQLINGRYRLQRDLAPATLDLQATAWSLHTLTWDLQETRTAP